MRLLDREAIHTLLKSEKADSLFVDPLLDEKQVGAVSIDLRLGYDFLVSILSRQPYLGVKHGSEPGKGPEGHFQSTRRDIGNSFVLYPSQVVIATTLEYLSLPSNVYGDLLIRSSYARLGIHLNTMLQPGYRGCASLELVNHSNNAIELVVGSRLVQLRLFRTGGQQDYLQSNSPRKYYGDVRPTISKVDQDSDLAILSRIDIDGV